MTHGKKPEKPTTDLVRAVTAARQELRRTARVLLLLSLKGPAYELAEVHKKLGKQISDIAVAEREVKEKANG